MLSQQPIYFGVVQRCFHLDLNFSLWNRYRAMIKLFQPAVFGRFIIPQPQKNWGPEFQI
jgi:hypothetical protein